ncbi:hypothetical protein [Brevundimonas faecalis]|uniref:Uncharacterized protein n=1 Tax=Brevundimonas faecalis TaxID=947378 RepID=A0ABV2R781_9CAUL
MITNIHDRRTNLHLWRTIDAVAEATWHDNHNPDVDGSHDNADPSASIASGDIYAVRTAISVADAVTWAHAFADEITLYLYDAGSYDTDEG